MSPLHCRSFALALVVSVLSFMVLARTAAAAPSAPSATSSSASGSAAGRSGSHAPASNSTAVCTLPGLVRSDGSRCPGNHHLRREIFGVPGPLPLPGPLPYPNPGEALTTVAGGAFKKVALTVLVGWVASSAESALKDTAKVISDSTRPQLTSSWFSASYWRIAAIAALLTLPFLCAAAIHALVRSDLGLLTRAAFGYLPLSLLAVGIASQLTMLLLSSVDEMSSIVASASADSDGVFLSHTAVDAVAASVGGVPFVAFLAAVITVAAALTLWLELLVRDAAVYVIVLMLPLFFAAMVWPARRMLAIRAIETLIALILSKFAIVAVLALGGVALGHSSIPGPTTMLMGATLVMLAAFSPWALLRMLPLHEVASAAAGGLSQGLQQTGMAAADSAVRAATFGAGAAEWLRPRLAFGTRSPLDKSPSHDAHRSATTSASEPADDSADPGDAGGGLEPVAAGIGGGPLGGGGAPSGNVAGSDTAVSGEWSWPPRSSAPLGADAVAGGAGGAAATDRGGSPGPNGSAAAAAGASLVAVVRGTGDYGPDSDRSPLADPDAGAEPIELPDTLSALVDPAATRHDQTPASPSLDESNDAATAPLTHVGHDPLGPPAPPPGRDPSAVPEASGPDALGPPARSLDDDVE